MTAFGAAPGAGGVRRWLGWPNLGKRLQARDIMAMVAPRPGLRILDVGCGGGQFAIEFARRGADVVGVDLDPASLAALSAGRRLEGLRLGAAVADAYRLPFAEGTFDCVFSSELLNHLPDLEGFFAELRRVLRPGGRVVVAHGLGHPAIERLYAGGRAARLRRLLGERVPRDYGAYSESLHRSFGNATTRFLSVAEMTASMDAAGLRVVSQRQSPGRAASSTISYLMFAAHVAGLRTYGRGYFVLYPLLAVADRIDPRRDGTGLLLAAVAA